MILERKLFALLVTTPGYLLCGQGKVGKVPHLDESLQDRREADERLKVTQPPANFPHQWSNPMSALGNHAS